MKSHISKTIHTFLIIGISLFTNAKLRADDAVKEESKKPIKTLRIMPLGDSITVGYTDNSVWKEPFEFGYRSGLYSRLTEAKIPFTFVGESKEPWNNFSGDPTHKNTVTPKLDIRKFAQDKHRGRGGASIPFLQKHVAKWMTADKPDIILLLIGINGIHANSHKELDKLVDTIFKTDSKVNLIVAQITPLKRFNQHLLNYNNYIIKTLAPKYTEQKRNISTVDLYTYFLTDPKDPKSIDIKRLSNRINHPSNPMYDKMAESWYEGIKALNISK